MSGIAVSFFTPKGGVGKTTITAIMGAILNAHFKNLKIACIDIDYLQQNLAELRNRDLYLAENYEKYKDLLEECGTYPITVADTENAKKKILEYKEKYDIVFVDAPGTLIDEKLTSILLNIDYFIVPCYPDVLGMDTTVKFLKVLSKVENIETSQLKDFTVLFNLYSKIYDRQEMNKFIAAENHFSENLNVNVLKNKVFRRSEIEDQRSTIYPLKYRENDDASIYNVAQEILKFLKLVN